MRRAEKNLLKAVDLMRYVVESVGGLSGISSEEFLSPFEAIACMNRLATKDKRTHIILYQCVPGTEFRKILLVYDAKHDSLTSPIISYSFKT